MVGPKPARRRPAFSVVELIVVIGVIVILVSILIVGVGKVQKAARAADSASQISQLQAAIETYYGEFKAYPGPLPDEVLHQSSNTIQNSTVPPGLNDVIIAFNNGVGGQIQYITGTENL